MSHVGDGNYCLFMYNFLCGDAPLEMGLFGSPDYSIRGTENG